MFRRAVVVATMLAMVCAAAASAQPNRTQVRRHPLNNRECVAACRARAVECLKDARAEAAPCFESCQPLVEAAREACAADPRSEACEIATRAARACLEPCQDILRPALRACIAAGHACVRACSLVGEPPCLTGCRVDHGNCLERSKAALVACRAGCSGAMTLARELCAADPESTACRRATAAAHQCLQPCRERHAAQVKTCQGALRLCVQACEEESGGSD